jgi:hypothetical protein
MILNQTSAAAETTNKGQTINKVPSSSTAVAGRSTRSGNKVNSTTRQRLSNAIVNKMH